MRNPTLKSSSSSAGSDWACNDRVTPGCSLSCWNTSKVQGTATEPSTTWSGLFNLTSNDTSRALWQVDHNASAGISLKCIKSTSVWVKSRKLIVLDSELMVSTQNQALLRFSNLNYTCRYKIVWLYPSKTWLIYNICIHPKFCADTFYLWTSFCVLWYITLIGSSSSFQRLSNPFRTTRALLEDSLTGNESVSIAGCWKIRK